MNFCRKCLQVFALGLLSVSAQAQSQVGNYVGKQGTWYGSWGYNEAWYTLTNLHISQPSQGNNYSFQNLFAEDKTGWDYKLIGTALTIPQYNYRIGHWFKDDWAIELNFDHTKYEVPQQLLHMTGTFHGRPVDSFFVNNGSLVYYLNNGANFFLFNLVHRWQVPGVHFRNFNASVLWKGGIGFLYPHVQNTIFGQANTARFQFGGLDMGGEAALRLTFFRYLYLEYCNKFVFADYWGLEVYQGDARQHFGTYEMIANLGFSVPLKRSAARQRK